MRKGVSVREHVLNMINLIHEAEIHGATVDKNNIKIYNIYINIILIGNMYIYCISHNLIYGITLYIIDIILYYINITYLNHICY